MIDKIAPYAKAIIAPLAAGLGLLATFVVGPEVLADVTTSEWIAVAITMLTTAGVTYAVPNKEPVA